MTSGGVLRAGSEFRAHMPYSDPPLSLEGPGTVGVTGLSAHPDVAAQIRGSAEAKSLQGMFALRGSAELNIMRERPPYALTVPEDWTSALDQLSAAGEVVAVVGDKSAGKSTFARVLCNAWMHPDAPDRADRPVFWLDTDLGQPEFVPPGTVSLMRVDSLMVGPAFTRTRCPEHDHEAAYFIGVLSVRDDPSRFAEAVRRLAPVVHDLRRRGARIVVNTHGWITGVGLTALSTVLDLLCPSHVVTLGLTPGDMQAFDGVGPALDRLRAARNPDAPLALQHLSAPVQSLAPPPIRLRPFEHRDLRVIGYLSQYFAHLCPSWPAAAPCPPSLAPTSNRRPFEAAFSDIAVALLSQDPDNVQALRTMNTTLVALASGSVSAAPSRPNVLRVASGRPLIPLRAFAVVRAIDPSRHVIQIISPATPHQLSDATVIMAGSDIALPKPCRTWYPPPKRRR